MARTLFVLYAAIQLLVPLRSLGPRDELLWTEAGFRWSWRVMVMEKVGTVRFRVRDPQSGREELVEPRRYLTPVQERMMATQPDLIRAFARFLHDEASRERGADVEVRSEGLVFLDGRPGRPLVDPSVDLARAGLPRDPARWVVPLGP